MENKISDRTYFWDIETSTITTDCGYEMQITYLSNVVTLDCVTGDIIESKFFRTISETVEYFKTLPSCIVWAHNLDYELSFLFRDIQPKGLLSDINKVYQRQSQDIIFRDKNAPLSVTLNDIPNVTFRDTWALFSKSIAKLGDDIGLPKLEYDYKKVRLPWEDLEQLDYDYNERDNVIAAKSIYKYMKDNDISVNEIPLTFTSAVRQQRNKFIKYNFGPTTLNKFYHDRNNSYISFDFIEDLFRTYQGGLTASVSSQTSKLITNEDHSGVISFDIKSSYPYQMCTRKFPIFDKANTRYAPFADEIYKSGNYKGYVGTFTLKNIKIKSDKYLLPISSSQLSKGEFSEDAEFYNGKLISASSITLPVNDIDMDVILSCYDVEEVKCRKITTAEKEQYLRIEEISFLLHNFLIKETLDKDSELYTMAKVVINAMYGIKVSNPIKDFYEIVDGEVLVEDYFKFDTDTRKQLYNNFVDTQSMYGGSLDVYSHGVYITSFARKQLIDMMIYIVGNGGHVVYCDTDSLKFYCDTDKTLQDLSDNIINMNNNTINKNKKNPRFKSFKTKFKVSDVDYEKICTLGIWENECIDKATGSLIPYKAFMTYGAKKYGYIKHNDKIETTIAGCNKKNIPVVIENVAKKNDLSLLDAFSFVFSPGTTFDETASGRTTAYKEKIPVTDMIDMKYKGRKINQFGGTIIKDTTYTLNMTLRDSQLVNFNETDLVAVKINMEGEVTFE